MRGLPRRAGRVVGAPSGVSEEATGAGGAAWDRSSRPGGRSSPVRGPAHWLGAPPPCGVSAFCLSQPARKGPSIRPGRRVISRTENSNSMWGGRFAAGPSALMREINASIGFDKRLWRQDLRASRAHVAMLAAQGLVSREDAAPIGEGLDRIAAESGRAGVPEHPGPADIHIPVETPPHTE